MKIHVLVAEDEAVSRNSILESLKRILPNAEYELVENGVQAINFAERTPALEIAFLDIHMPLVDGIQAACHIRSWWQDCQIIFLTAYSDYEYMREALDLRATDYLLKPFSQTGLAAAVQKARNRLVFLDNARKKEGNGKVQKLPGIPDWIKTDLLASFISGTVVLLHCPKSLPTQQVCGMIRGNDWKAHLKLQMETRDNTVLLLVSSPIDENLSAQLYSQMLEMCNRLYRLKRATPYCAVGKTMPTPELIGDSIRQCETLLHKCSGVTPVLQIGNENVNVSQEQEVLQEKKQIEQYLAAHFQDEITLERIASDLGYSRTYFSKRFKQLFQKNFVNYLTLLRVEEAKKLLSDPTAEIRKAALKSGFQDAAYFTSVFRRVTGYTPSEYRKKEEETK